MRALTASNQRVVIAIRIINADGPTWFHRYSGDPVITEIKFDRMISGRERCLDGLMITQLRIKTHVARCTIPELWCPLGNCAARIRHSIKRRIINDDMIRGIDCLRFSLGDDKSDGFTKMPYFLTHQRIMRAVKDRRAIRVLKGRGFGTCDMGRVRDMWQGSETIGLIIRGGQNRDDA